ncbi:MAG: AI-2E family transporter [Clostridia bacterium]|nr:AI-2E family transporter [Clostridia bacterium]
MDRNEKNKYLYIFLTGFGIIAAGTLFFFLIFRWSNVSEALANVFLSIRPILVGAVIAYIQRPICSRLEASLCKVFPKKLESFANGLSVTITMLAAAVIVYVFSILVLPQIYSNLISLRHTLPVQLTSLVNIAKDYFQNMPSVLTVIDEAVLAVNEFTENWVNNILIANLQTIMNGTLVGVNIVKDVLVGIVAAIYLLASRKSLCRICRLMVKAIFPPKWSDIIFKETMYADTRFAGFLTGKLVDSLIIGVLCYFCMLIFSFPNAMLISVLIGVTNIIPYFGPFIGGIPAAILVLIQSPSQAVGFIIFVLVLQQVDGNIIGPKILGNSTGLKSFWVMFAILLFGGTFGVIGMILGVPLFAVIYDITKQLVSFGLKKKGIDEDVPISINTTERPKSVVTQTLKKFTAKKQEKK